MVSNTNQYSIRYTLFDTVTLIPFFPYPFCFFHAVQLQLVLPIW
jgi:hypothetical protein